MSTDLLWIFIPTIAAISLTPGMCMTLAFTVGLSQGYRHTLGYASALNKSIIVIHSDDHQHPLKEVDAAACAVTKDQNQAVKILKYILEGTL